MTDAKQTPGDEKPREVFEIGMPWDEKRIWSKNSFIIKSLELFIRWKTFCCFFWRDLIAGSEADETRVGPQCG